MSVLDRYLNTEKYQGEMRDLVNAQILNDKTQCGLFLKDTALARIGWSGNVKQFPKAEEYVHTYNNGDKNEGIFFKTPRMVILHCGFRKVITEKIRFMERGREIRFTVWGFANSNIKKTGCVIK